MLLIYFPVCHRVTGDLIVEANVVPDGLGTILVIGNNVWLSGPTYNGFFGYFFSLCGLTVVVTEMDMINSKGGRR